MSRHVLIGWQTPGQNIDWLPVWSRGDEWMFLTDRIVDVNVSTTTGECLTDLTKKITMDFYRTRALTLTAAEPMRSSTPFKRTNQNVPNVGGRRHEGNFLRQRRQETLLLLQMLLLWRDISEGNTILFLYKHS